MNGNFKLSKVAALLAGCSLLAGCGSDNAAENPSKTSSYAYSKLAVCIDADLSGSCSELEQTVTSFEQTAGNSQGPYLIDKSGYFLSAPATAKTVNPFTTLVQNELMFNPAVAGNPAQAQQHLQAIFGDKYGIDFKQLNSTHGPRETTEQLLASFRHALSLNGESNYLKISAAVDKMISEKSFDITSSLTQADLDNSSLNLNNRYLLSGSYPLSSLLLPDSITMNEGTGTLLALLQDKKLLQVNTATGSYISFSPEVANSTEQKSMGVTFKSHHHKDHHDDDDDHHIVLPAQKPSILIHAAQGRTPREAYLLYWPSIVGDSSISNTCNSSGDNGIFLTEIGKNSKVKKLSTLKNIDSYSSASGYEPPALPDVDEKPTVPVSSASCRNNHISGITPIYLKDKIAAVFTNGSSQQIELQLLSSTNLAPLGKRYHLSSSQPLLVTSKKQDQLLVVEGKGNDPVILDSETLNPRAFINKKDIQYAAFTNNDRTLIVSDGSPTLSWFNTGNTTSPVSTLALDDNVSMLASDPSGKLSAALTKTHIYLIDNESKKVIKSETYDHSFVYGMSMLSDKIIISRSGAIDYIQFGNLVGSPIKLGYQLVTKTLVDKWAVASNNSFNSTTLSYLLETVGEEKEISQQFSEIDLEWIPANAQTASELKAVMISGYYRNERISLIKNF